MAKKKFSFLKLLLWLLLFLILLAGGTAYVGYRLFYVPNTSPEIRKSEIVLIPTGSTFERVMDTLRAKKILKDTASFKRLAALKKYKDKIKPGRYRILAGMNNNEILNLLRAGLQEPVNLTFTNIRTRGELVSRICRKIEADSSELALLLDNDTYLKNNFGLKKETALTLFIPNTYQLKWNTSAKQFMDRMQSEYKKFWTPDRKAKAKAIGLTPTQVSVLASVVQAEQLQYPEERPVIAGLYLNRLKLGMCLQSDPTVIYAIGDFTINRVLDKDKLIGSPYNTYVCIGLPPGPIYIPEISSIDAVLNYQKNDYLYMCAKEDFSGKHNFARTLAEHNANAMKYRKALNKEKIFR